MIELNTILTEVEALLNSRHLTYPYMDINDGSLPTQSEGRTENQGTIKITIVF